jgi:hypothetical protein
MAEYVEIKLTPHEYELHIVKRNSETRREEAEEENTRLREENTRLREENRNLKSQVTPVVTRLVLSNERFETCAVCRNQLSNPLRCTGAAMRSPSPL